MRIAIIVIMLLCSGCGPLSLDFKLRMGGGEEGAVGKRQTEETVYYDRAVTPLPPAAR